MSQIVTISSTDSASCGTRDGQGASDRDQPYEFDRRPRAHAPFPFSVHQYARLLILRGRVADGSAGIDDTGQTRLPLRSPPRVTSLPSPWCRCVDCGDRAPLALQLGEPMRCGPCARTHIQREVADAILYTAGVRV